jgi:hypothetical protein
MNKELKGSAGTRGRYLYAIIAGSEQRAFGNLGLNGGQVYTISDNGVAAVVSDIPQQKIRPERRHFAAHQGVLRRVMEECDLLPMRFGVISGGPKAVRGLLAKNRDAIASQLQRVAGKVEMGLKVGWDVPNIFEYMISIHPELMAARERLLNPQRGPTQEEKIQVGLLFEDLLTSDRERHTKRVERALKPACSEIKRNKCREEREVMNLACLVGRAVLPAFEDAVLKAAGLFDDNFIFDYNGPWAPHNFAEVEVQA